MSETTQQDQPEYPADVTAEEKAEAKKQAASKAEPKFSRERLLSIESERITGHPRYVVVAVLSGDDTTEFTRGQIVKKIENFLASPVEQEA